MHLLACTPTAADRYLTHTHVHLPFVPCMQLRKDRAEFKPDDRFLHVVNMIRTGQFGWADCEYAGPLQGACPGGSCVQSRTAGRPCMHCQPMRVVMDSNVS